MAVEITLTTGALPDDARVVAFKGHETIGLPYEFEVFFSTKKPDDVDLEAALFQPATLELERKEDTRKGFKLRGVIAGIDHVHEEDDYALFSLKLVPRLWLLGVSEHSRIFVDQKLDDIIREIVAQVGITGSSLSIGDLGLQPEDHITQYRESDLAFLHRWIEREGILYWFDHEPDEEKLVVTIDQPSEEVPGGAIAYHPLLDKKSPNYMSEPHIDRVRTKRITAPQTVRMTDYDYLKPRLEIAGEELVLTKGKTRIVDFAPEHFFDPDKAKALAKYRAQALRSKQEVQEVEGNVLGLRVGRIFELAQHPRSALNQKYAVIEIEHSGVQQGKIADIAREMLGIDQEDSYRMKAVCLAQSVEYRLPRRTPWPVVGSFELARIDGEMDSEYAQLDDEGRYKLKFLFDEGLGKDGKASMWVRMMQPHAGNPEGFHFPLRKETEVVVTFLAGDPDRPVISGAIPNSETPSPITHRNQTRNILVTGGRNKIEIEDLDGQQWFDLDCPIQNTRIHMGHPKPWSVASANFGTHTDGTAVFTYGGDWWVDVGGFHDEHVKGHVKQLYESTKNETVTAKVTEAYNADHQTTVQGHRTLTVNSGQTDTVHAGWKQTIDPILDQTINGMWKQNVTGNWTQTIAPNWTLGVASNVTWNVGANVDWTVGGQTNINCPVINVIGATFNQTDSSANYWYDFQLKLVGLNLYGNIIVAGANGLKAEANGIKLEADFVELKTVKIKTAAELQEFLTGLLHSEFTVLKIFG